MAIYRGMSNGIRVELSVPEAAVCPVARTASATGESAYAISKSADPTLPQRITEEFAVESHAGDVTEGAGSKVTKVFESGEQSVYRFRRAGRQDCPCECVERHGLPVIDVRADEDALSLVFHSPDQAALRDVVETIREHFPGVEVQRLLQSDPEGEQDSLVFFDRAVFTDRQQEVLETAHRMGYFDHPKGANAGEVAEALDITASTFSEHLAAAQRKLLDAIIDGE